MKRVQLYLPLLIPLLIFSALFLPFLHTVPCGNRLALYNHAVLLLTKGVGGYFQIEPVYPPVVSITPNIFFKLFGVGPLGYNINGFFIGLLGIIGIYLLSMYLFPKKKLIPVISAFLLSTFPAFITNGINPTDYYYVTALSILCYYFYAKKRTIIYAFISSLAVLSKDIALLLPFSIILVDLIYAISKKQLNLNYVFSRLIILLMPFFVYFLWADMIRGSGTNLWHENFYGDQKYSSFFYSAFYQTLTFDFFNDLSMRHLITLLYLNFNWIYWLIAGFGLIFLVKQKRGLWKSILSIISEPAKSGILLFCILYAYTILTAQTDPIPAQSLPIIPYLIIGASLSITFFIKRGFFRISVVTFALLLFTFLHLFYPKDPLGNILWDQKMANEQRVYYLKKSSKDNFFVYNIYPLCSVFK